MAIDLQIRGTAEVLGVPLSDNAVRMMVEDILEKYGYESFEDIVLCLKSGRRGDYGNHYNKLNGVVFGEWMAQHLDKKAALRELMLHNQAMDHQRLQGNLQELLVKRGFQVDGE
jgi:hypothetical protein